MIGVGMVVGDADERLDRYETIFGCEGRKIPQVGKKIFRFSDIIVMV